MIAPPEERVNPPGREVPFARLKAYGGTPPVAVNVAVDGADVCEIPDGSTPDAVAVFETDPASISACVTVYVAVHVTVAPGATEPAGHDTAESVPDPVNTPSLIPTACNVTLPVFVTR